jgi:hypothetical protein
MPYLSYYIAELRENGTPDTEHPMQCTEIGLLACPVMWSFGAAIAALDDIVFSSLSTGVDECVLSNGVPLERQ